MANNFRFRIDVDLPADATAKLKRAAETAFHQTAAELDGRFTDAISSSVWPWPRPSKRGVAGIGLKEKARNYAQAPYNTFQPRSIVDDGGLKQSKVFTLSGVTAKWSWTVDYAAAVHDGARIHPWGDPNNGTVTLPARPWTTAVLRGGTPGRIDVFPFSDELAKRIQRLLA